MRLQNVGISDNLNVQLYTFIRFNKSKTIEIALRNVWDSAQFGHKNKSIFFRYSLFVKILLRLLRIESLKI